MQTFINLVIVILVSAGTTIIFRRIQKKMSIDTALNTVCSWMLDNKVDSITIARDNKTMTLEKMEGDSRDEQV